MSDNEPSDLCNDQLLVGFSTHRRPSVRFASSADTVFPVRSTLTMIRQKNELWYSRRDVETMTLQMRLDATNLRRTLVSSAEDLEEGRLHVSQAVGLEKVINPTLARNNRRIRLQHRMAIVQLQDLTSDDELCRVSQVSSRSSSERARKVANTFLGLDE